MGRLVKEDEVVGGRYRITGPLLGEGSFAEVYPAEDAETKQQVAVKIEKNQGDRVVMATELKALEGLQGLPFVCKLYGNGTHRCRDKNHQFIAMERVGNTLAELRKAREPKRFSVATTFAVGVQMLDALQAVHSRGYIHRDVKPANFTVGYGTETRRIRMIDYGLARKFLDDAGNVQSQRTNAQFRGSSKYASVNTHQNEDQGRRDDLWSMFYLLVEVLDGELPWTEASKTDKDLVLRMKLECLDKPSGLTQNVELPPEMCELCAYLKTLSFADEPDYAAIRRMLSAGIARTLVFDWESTAPAAATFAGTTDALGPSAAATASGGGGAALPWYNARSAAPSTVSARTGSEAPFRGAKRARLAAFCSDEQLARAVFERPENEWLERSSSDFQSTLRGLCQLPPNEVFAACSIALRAALKSNGRSKERLQPLVTDFAALASTLRDQCRPDARPERDVHRR